MCVYDLKSYLENNKDDQLCAEKQGIQIVQKCQKDLA